ncbi:IS110 family transposase [Pontibacter korlensis]|uniref:IS110 family transposase n=1 Tax=Pontibacter korlensis TaxID=400092 RepID=UPI000698A05E|nr:IS110 family transposase [Pontibacter korlensis]
MKNLLCQNVGVDVSKDSLEVTFSTLEMDRRVKVKATRKFANTPAGFKQLQRWLESKRAAQVELRLLMEATGVYYEQLAWFLFQQGYQVSVVLPTKAKRYLQALGHRSKNDKIDARGLAQMGLEQLLELWQPLSPNIYQLRLLTRQLEEFTNQRTVCLNQLHALHHGALVVKQVERNLQKMVRVLENSLQELEEAIGELLYQDPLLAERVDKMLSIKGVGLKTVAVLLAETNGFATFERQGQLVSYAGYDVVEHQSGLRAGRTRISKKGNAHIRRAMHMPALSAVRFQEPRFVALYERLVKRGKTKMQAYVAVQRKLLVLLWTLWRKNEAYDPRYGQQPAEPKNNIQIQEAGASLSGVSAADKDAITQETQPETAEKEIAPAQARATQDELPVPVGPGALFQVE